MSIYPIANVGDLVVFKTKQGKWQTGWSVVDVTRNSHGVVTEIVATKGKAKMALDLFGDITAVYILPPKDEVSMYADILKDYPNLLLGRCRACAKFTYVMLCTRCWSILSVECTYTECAELELWNDRVVSSKPCIDGGNTKIHCDCKGKKGVYDIEFDPY